MHEPRRLLCVLAHPDDESLGAGGILAQCAVSGIETHLVTATRGEYGWTGPAAEDPGPTALGRIREAELRAAAAVLQIQTVELLDYIDGQLAQANAAEAIASIVGHVRRVRPQVVITFAPDGATGHPDHIAISQMTAAAMVGAADPTFSAAAARDWPAHRVDRLSYLVESCEKVAAFDAVFGESAMVVDGVKRAVAGWPDWAITTRVDTTAHWQQVWQAIICHRTQLPGYAKLVDLPEETHRSLWGTQEFYCVFDLAGGASGLAARSTDIFAGLG